MTTAIAARIYNFKTDKTRDRIVPGPDALITDPHWRTNAERVVRKKLRLDPDRHAVAIRALY